MCFEPSTFWRWGKNTSRIQNNKAEPFLMYDSPCRPALAASGMQLEIMVAMATAPPPSVAKGAMYRPGIAVRVGGANATAERTFVGKSSLHRSPVFKWRQNLRFEMSFAPQHLHLGAGCKHTSRVQNKNGLIHCVLYAYMAPALYVLYAWFGRPAGSGKRG